ncbi:hypothetical protein JCM11641_001190 [Rhodosporidiobolus odoratus]
MPSTVNRENTGSVVSSFSSFSSSSSTTPVLPLSSSLSTLSSSFLHAPTSAAAAMRTDVPALHISVSQAMTASSELPDSSHRYTPSLTSTISTSSGSSQSMPSLSPLTLRSPVDGTNSPGSAGSAHDAGSHSTTAFPFVAPHLISTRGHAATKVDPRSNSLNPEATASSASSIFASPILPSEYITAASPRKRSRFLDTATAPPGMNSLAHSRPSPLGATFDQTGDLDSFTPGTSRMNLRRKASEKRYNIEEVSDGDGAPTQGSVEEVDPMEKVASKSVTGSGAFIYKLYQLLHDPTFQHLVKFSEEGDSFTVFDPDLFASECLGRHFKHSNFSSFVRQLNMYGFHKVNKLPRGVRTTDPAWEFSHAEFRRGDIDALDRIKRRPPPPATADDDQPRRARRPSATKRKAAWQDDDEYEGDDSTFPDSPRAPAFPAAAASTVPTPAPPTPSVPPPFPPAPRFFHQSPPATTVAFHLPPSIPAPPAPLLRQFSGAFAQSSGSLPSGLTGPASPSLGLFDHSPQLSVFPRPPVIPAQPQPVHQINPAEAIRAERDELVTLTRRMHTDLNLYNRLLHESSERCAQAVDLASQLKRALESGGHQLRDLPTYVFDPRFPDASVSLDIIQSSAAVPPSFDTLQQRHLSPAHPPSHLGHLSQQSSAEHLPPPNFPSLLPSPVDLVPRLPNYPTSAYAGSSTFPPPPFPPSHQRHFDPSYDHVQQRPQQHLQINTQHLFPPPLSASPATATFHSLPNSAEGSQPASFSGSLSGSGSGGSEAAAQGLIGLGIQVEGQVYPPPPSQHQQPFADPTTGSGGGSGDPSSSSPSSSSLRHPTQDHRPLSSHLSSSSLNAFDGGGGGGGSASGSTGTAGSTSTAGSSPQQVMRGCTAGGTRV